MHFLSRILLTVLLGGAVFTDLRSGRIFNAWLIPWTVSGALLRLAEDGLPALPVLLFLMFLTLLFLFPFYRTGGLGAGDIKLLMAVCTFLSPAEYVSCLMAILLVSALYACLVLLLRKDIHHGLHMALPIAAGVLLHVGGVF
jgi:prepilin peptidase CpaA